MVDKVNGSGALSLQIWHEPDPEWECWKLHIGHEHGRRLITVDYYTKDQPTSHEVAAFAQDAAVKIMQQIEKLEKQARNERIAAAVREKHGP